ncbi:MAG: Fic family protein [Sphingomonadaceae bacterium]|nr:Fic family protein [Sphingomonadaceae bacterium]
MRSTDGRSGRYVKQPNRYSAFIPADLPPTPHIQVDGTLQTALSKADRALGRLDGSIQTLPDPELFVFMYVRKEAVLSSQIEGTQSSLNDLLEAEARLLSPKRPNDVGEVINYVNAMNYGLKRMDDIPVSIRLIKEIHEILLKNVRGNNMQPGEIRTSQNWIGPQGCSLNEALFIPPPPHEVMQHLGALENFIHTETDIPPLIKIGLIHAQFETIHPFLDGNGRIGRLLITFLLTNQTKILIKPVLYLSYYFKRHRQEYYDRLQDIRDKGAWEEWLTFFLTAVAVVSNEATDTARAIVSMRERHRELVIEKCGRAAGNGLKLLEHLYRQPILQVGDVSSFLAVSYPAANEIVNRMVELEILSEITGNARNRVFQYSPYVRLFSDPVPTG